MELGALYRDIVEMSPDAIWVCDLDGRTIYANPAMCASTAPTPRRWRRSPSSTPSTSPDACSSPSTSRSSSASAATSEDVDVLFWRRDGTSLWVIVSERELRGPDGEIVGFTHRISDYSGRRRALDELHESREQLAEAHRIARLGSWQWDLRDRRDLRLGRALRALRPRPGVVPGELRQLPRHRPPERPGGRRRSSARCPRAAVGVPVRRPDRRRGRLGLDPRPRRLDGRRDRPGGRDVGHPPGHHRDQARRPRPRGPGPPERPDAGGRRSRRTRPARSTRSSGQAQHLVLLHDDWERGRAFVPDEAGTAVVPLHISDERPGDGRVDPGGVGDGARAGQPRLPGRSVGVEQLPAHASPSRSPTPTRCWRWSRSRPRRRSTASR